MTAQQDWSRSGAEPRLEEIIHDPIVQLVMRRDRLTIGQIMAIVTKARARLRSDATEQAACPDPVSCAFRPSS